MTTSSKQKWEQARAAWKLKVLKQRGITSKEQEQLEKLAGAKVFKNEEEEEQEVEKPEIIEESNQQRERKDSNNSSGNDIKNEPPKVTPLESKMTQTMPELEMSNENASLLLRKFYHMIKSTLSAFKSDLHTIRQNLSADSIQFVRDVTFEEAQGQIETYALKQNAAKAMLDIEIASLKERNMTLETTIEEKSERIASLQSAGELLCERIAAAEQKLREATACQEDMRTQHDAALTEINRQHSKSMSTLSARFEKARLQLQRKVDTSQQQVTALTKKVTEKDDYINTIEKSHSVTVKNLKEKKEEMSLRVAELERTEYAQVRHIEELQRMVQVLSSSGAKETTNVKLIPKLRNKTDLIGDVVERIYARDAQRSEEWLARKNAYQDEVKDHLVSLTELCITRHDHNVPAVRYKDFVRRLHISR